MIIAGGRKEREKLKAELKESPLTLYQKEVKMVDSEKYLGVQIAATVSDSITKTVDKRAGLALKASYEIRTVVEDYRAPKSGAIKIGLDLWESSVIPMLLYGSEVWSNIPKKVIKKSSDINTTFLANLLGVSKKRDKC